MRFEVLVILFLGTFQVALACCGSKSVTSCCGNGKCNIFCCNCKGGCDEKCVPATSTICWVFGETIQCRDRRSTDTLAAYDSIPRSIEEYPGYNVAARAQSEEDEKMFGIVDKDGKGWFTFDEFLEYTHETASAEVADYFHKFDVNGDGVISLEEMRLLN